MNYFCTLFDSHYLSRGLAMLESLSATGISFHLYVFAFDDLSYQILQDLELPHVTVISLKEFENKALLAVKPTRSKGEYCWTCTPSTIAYCLDTYDLPSCTYLDADLFFFKSPQVLLDEMKEDAVLLTEHRYTACYDQTLRSGRFCVQFMSFKNNEAGRKVLTWWRDACIDWCYDRIEPNRFGDQKYLDDWPERFQKVHVLEHLGGGVAPWNVQQYRIFKDETLKGQFQNTSFDIIFYHFHALKFMQKNAVDLGGYRLSPSVVKLIYQPYIKKLGEIEKSLEAHLEPRLVHGKLLQAPSFLQKLKRKWRGCYNIFSKEDFAHG